MIEEHDIDDFDVLFDDAIDYNSGISNFKNKKCLEDFANLNRTHFYK